MAVTILERPEGRLVVGSSNTAPYTNGSSNIAKVAHGFTTGDIVYISDSQAMGFWYVTAVTVDIFNIRQYAGATVYTWLGAGTFTYYLTYDAESWSAVHLPITYRLSNDLYPTNSADTTRNITSVVDYNSFTVINLSGSLGSGVNTYDFVKITVPNDTDLSGVYQIVEFITPTILVINLDYDSSNNFTSATALKHYNNYNIIVRIYAGLNASHEWASEKPYELAATKEFTPDENNQVFFSINEILKSYIEPRNNLILGTLPNNLDFWTQFYIEVAESYDDSDGYVFGTFTGNFTSDQSTFEGNAINAKLEFKNAYSGFMSEWTMVDADSKFLTLMDEPVLFDGLYQDISFIKPTDDTYTLSKQFYLNGNAGLLETESISGDAGVYRVQLTANCDYDRVDISLTMDQTIEPATGELIFTGYAPEIYVGPPT